jgi:phosphoribosyl 1,2-cyclic phosphate phosphodiesterase
MLTNRIHKFDALLFTHEHADHTAGLDDLRPFFFRQGAIQCYMSQRVGFTKNVLRHMMTTTDKYQVLQILMFIYEDFTINGIHSHTSPKQIMVFLRVHGFRIGNLACY